MNTPDIGAILDGSQAVIQWFAAWPSFQDAEIMYLQLARTGQSVLRPYPYYPNKPAAADFILEGVTDLQLADFSSQNVISSLGVETIVDQTKEKAVGLTFSPCYGLAGRSDATCVRVEVVAGKSSDGVSQW